MKITIVSGARPNFMKIAPICRAIDAAREAGKNISYRIVYTGPQDRHQPGCLALLRPLYEETGCLPRRHRT